MKAKTTNQYGVTLHTKTTFDKSLYLALIPDDFNLNDVDSYVDIDSLNLN